MTGNRHVVWTWLHTLDQEHLFESFLENGYDDLETVKQMGEEDLLAIGVEDQETRFVINQAAKMLREKGAAWVYFIRCIESYIHVSILRKATIQNNTWHWLIHISRDDLDCENDYEKPGSESSGVSSWKSWQEADAQFRVRTSSPSFICSNSCLSSLPSCHTKLPSSSLV